MCAYLYRVTYNNINAKYWINVNVLWHKRNVLYVCSRSNKQLLEHICICEDARKAQMTANSEVATRKKLCNNSNA